MDFKIAHTNTWANYINGFIAQRLDKKRDYKLEHLFSALRYNKIQDLQARLIALSDRVIRQVATHLVGRSSNKPEDLEHTGGWSNVLSAAAYESSLNLEALEYSGKHLLVDYFKPGLLGVEYIASNAVRTFMARGGNCDYQSDLACWYFAQQWAIEDLEVRKVEPKGTSLIDHVVLELSLGDIRVYCDPWLGKTFVGPNVSKEITEAYLAIEEACLMRIKKHAPARELCWISLRHFLKGYDYDYLAFYEDVNNIEIGRENLKKDRQKLINKLKENLKGEIFFQPLTGSSSKDFVLHKNNREDFLLLTELGYLFELREHYPSNPYLTSKIDALLIKYLNRLEKRNIPLDVIAMIAYQLTEEEVITDEFEALLKKIRRTFKQWKHEELMRAIPIASQSLKPVKKVVHAKL